MSDEEILSSQDNGTSDEVIESGLNSQVQDSQEENSEDTESQQEENKDGKEKSQTEDVNELVGKPETYSTEEVKLPEGMELNQEVMKEFNEFADKTNLSQKGYNQAIEYGIKLVEQTKSNMLEAFKQAEEQKIMDYRRASFADKEIGGDNYSKALSEASPAYNKFVSAECQQLFRETGLEYHPAVIKLFRNISAEMSDDTFRSGAKATQEQSREQRMFPDMYANK